MSSDKPADEGSGLPESMTALDYLREQQELEEEAREVMPYDPVHCSHHDEPARQQIYACLTCKEKDGNPNGLCYSCSIQCHSNHEVVELWTKRNFSCDCGTERMQSFGGCNMRKNFQQLDKPSKTNQYSHNNEGRFCDCDKPDTMEQQPSTMFQCLLGDACLEDWYHEECILGVPSKKRQRYPTGENVYGNLESAESENVQAVDDRLAEGETMEGLPNESDFTAFVCWKCIDKNKQVFEKIKKLSSVHEPVARGEFSSLAERKTVIGEKRKREEEQEQEEETAKKVKTEDGSAKPEAPAQYSLFLKDGYQDELQKCEDEDIKKFVEKFPFLVENEPEYEPPPDNDTSSSLMDAGTRALHNLPREQALDGIQAYSMIKDRLTAFLRPFADEGKVVTETDVNDFFAKMEQNQKKNAMTG